MHSAYGLQSLASVLLAVLLSALGLQPLGNSVALVAMARVRDRSPKGREGRPYPALGPLGGKTVG